jgi:Amt family ammonium transporter
MIIRHKPIWIYYCFREEFDFTMSSSVFLTCQANSGDGNATQLLQCISDEFQYDSSAKAKDLNDFLLVIAGAMIFFMQSGFAMMCAGSVRLKNAQNTMLKNLLDACGAALAFYFVGEYSHVEINCDRMVVPILRRHVKLIYISYSNFNALVSFWWIGYAFAFGGQEKTTATTFIGTADFASVGSSASYWFFQYTFSATSVTIVAGTLAERCQMVAYLCYSIILAGFVYPVVRSLKNCRLFLSILQ